MDFTQLTENERIVITLLARKGALSKPQLKNEGNMSWATVVKIINRLLEASMIECVGTSLRDIHKGKNSYVYRLTGTSPLAIGVDIEYREINIILTDLCGEIRLKSSYPTPQQPGVDELRRYLLKVLISFIERCKEQTDLKSIKGVGIGLPGISIPSWLIDTSSDTEHKGLAEYLSYGLGMPVCIENNVRAYAMFEKWDKRMFSLRDFVLISIRTGVGSGIVLNGTLYSGYQSLAGEIAHFTVDPAGRQCRCGKKGCLETYVNQDILYKKYLELTGNPRSHFTNEEIINHLGELFTMARDGDKGAADFLKGVARSFAPHLANMLMVLNIRDIIISGHFGVDGDFFIRLLDDQVRAYILPKMQYSLRYYPLDEKGFIRGAALLILKEYFSDTL